jgi:hypothetical protein
MRYGEGEGRRPRIRNLVKAREANMKTRGSWAMLALLGMLEAAIMACQSPSGSKYPAPTPPTPPDFSQWTPALLTPAAGAVMDNGRTDGKDTIEWDFEWSWAPEMAQYEIEVWGPNTTIPIVKVTVPFKEPKYHHSSSGYIANANRLGWRWKVRACFIMIDLQNQRSWTEWRPWSAEQTFDVEPVDTDPAK